MSTALALLLALSTPAQDAPAQDVPADPGRAVVPDALVMTGAGVYAAGTIALAAGATCTAVAVARAADATQAPFQSDAVRATSDATAWGAFGIGLFAVGAAATLGGAGVFAYGLVSGE